MKRILYIIAALSTFAAISCSKENVIFQEADSSVSGEYVVVRSALHLNGEIESADIVTKTHLGKDGDGKLFAYWNSGDAIAVYDDVSRKIKMKAVKTSDQTAEFEPETEPDEFSTMAYAVYPYDAAGDIQVISEKKVLQLTLPSTQSYVKNSFGRGANVAVGQISEDNTKFMNVCGLLCLKLKRADVTVSRIELRANDGAKLSGSFAVDLDEEDMTAIPFGDQVTGDDVITLDCGTSGVALSSTAVSFYFVVPVGVFGNTTTDKGGFTATVITTDNKKYYVGTYNNTNVIARSSVCEMPAKTVSVIPDIHYDEAKYIESSNTTSNNNGSCVVWQPASSVKSLKTTIDGYKLEDRFSTSEVIFCINHFTASDGYWFGIAKDKNQWGWGTALTGLSCLGSSRRAVMTLTCVQNTKSKVSMYKTSATGTTYTATSDNGINSGDEIKTVSLFAGNFKSGADNHYCGKFRIYSVKFVSSSKTIGNLVPAYNKSTKKYGFYDLTQKKFFGNHADATKALAGALYD